MLTAILDRCRTKPPNILQTLIAVQVELGYVPLEAVPELARALGVTEADIAGVLSFYPDLRTQPTGRHLIRVCTGESCVANHCSRVLDALRERLGIDVGQTTPDDRFTLERVYCVGNCAVSPTVMVDEQVHGRVVELDIGSLLNEYQVENVSFDD